MSLLYETVAKEHPIGAELGKYLFTTRKLDLWNKDGCLIDFVYTQLMQLAHSAIS